MSGETTTLDPEIASAPTRGTLDHWLPEDSVFWRDRGRRIAWRNLVISIPCLLIAFAVWLCWSIVTVQMKNMGFPFSDAQLFTLGAVAGLSGATLRIPNSFMIAPGGGRNVIGLTTLLLILPSLGLGIALMDPNTPYLTFVVLAWLSGVGGGAFASSMSNISFFFPKRMQGLALGLNAGLGNLGVSLMQVLLPLVMLAPLFGPLSGPPQRLPAEAGGGAGGEVWIQNMGLVWVPLLALLTIFAFWGMNNLPVSNARNTLRALAKILGLELVGLVGAAIGVVMLIQLELSMWIVLPVTVVITTFGMKLFGGELGTSLQRQFAIFKEKHNWAMTWLYTMTFGSFIGYSMAFPLLIRVIYGTLSDGVTPNPNAPNPYHYAWLGPFVGSLVRPVGGWLSDKLGGARVTQWIILLSIGAALGVAWQVRLAAASDTPEEGFVVFLLLFLVLFLATGAGNGSTFRMVPIIFPPEKAGPVLGWISAIAAYGAFIIPRIFATQVKNHTPEYALYGFAAYYLTCLAVNWWYYARKNAEVPC